MSRNMRIWPEIRAVLRRPVRSIYAIVMLGLGLATLAAALSVRAGVAALTPWPRANAIYVAEFHGQGSFSGITFPEFEAAVQNLAGRIDLAVWVRQRAVISGGRGPETVMACFVSHSLFRILNIRPQLGRVFGKNQRSGVLISVSAWRSEFGSDPTILVRPVMIGRMTYHVAGIIADREMFPRGVEIYLPLLSSPTLVSMKIPLLAVLASPRAPMHEGAVAGAVARAVRFGGGRRESVVLTSMAELVAGHAREQMRLILVVVAMLLAAAWLNVAIILLLEADQRVSEVAIRQILGLGRRQLFVSALAESLVTCAAALLLGMVLAKLWGRVAIAGLAAAPVGGGGVATLAAAAGLCAILLAALGTYLYPPSNALRRLQQASHGNAGVTGHGGFGRYILAGEGAIAVILIAGACTFSLSLFRVAEISPGFRATGLWAAEIDETASTRQIRPELEARLSELAGINSVTAAAFGPLAGPEFSYSVAALPESGRGSDLGPIAVNAVEASYFSLLDVPLY